MARKPRTISRYQKAQQRGDQRFDSLKVYRFSSMVMKDGKRALSYRIIYNAFDYMYDTYEKMQEEKSSLPRDERIMELFDLVVDKARPAFEVKSRRIGGANYQIPVEVSRSRQEVIVMRWILAFARKRKGEPAWKKIGAELIDALNERGSVIKAKANLESMARANFAFYKRDKSKKSEAEEGSR